MEWLERAVEHGTVVLARVFTEQYLKSMKSLGFEAVNLLPSSSNPENGNSKVYCHDERCIIDFDTDGFYVVHTGNCKWRVND
jgi:hypothetical protein